MIIKEDFSERGFSILLPDDPAYSGELDKLGLSVGDRTSLVPGAVLVKNTSRRAVVAFGVRFTRRARDGHVATSDIVDNQPSALLDLGRPGRGVGPFGGLIMPGATRLVTPDGVLEPTSNGYTQYRTRSPWTIIKVQADCVVFDTGQAMGPDRLGVVEGLRAHVDAQQDLMDEITDKLSHGELLHDALLQLQSSAPPRSDPRSSIRLSSGKVYGLVRQQYLHELTATESKAGD